jgi:transposase
MRPVAAIVGAVLDKIVGPDMMRCSPSRMQEPLASQGRPRSSAALHSLRRLGRGAVGGEQLVRQRTMLVNALRAHLAEFGIVAAQGLRNVGQLIAVVRDSITAQANRATKSTVECGAPHPRMAIVGLVIGHILRVDDLAVV